MRLASGRTVEATANHPFLTVDGWCPLGELEVGDRLGTAAPGAGADPAGAAVRGPHRAARPADRPRVGGQPAAAALPRGRRPGGRPAPEVGSDQGARPEPGRHPGAAAGPVPPHLRPAQPARRLAGRAGPVRAAQPPEVRSGAGVRAAGRAAGAVPASTVGHRRHGRLGRAPAGRRDRSGLHQPAAGATTCPGCCCGSACSAGSSAPARRSPGTAGTCASPRPSTCGRSSAAIGVARRARRGGPARSTGGCSELADGTELNTIPNRVWTQVRSTARRAADDPSRPRRRRAVPGTAGPSAGGTPRAGPGWRWRRRCCRTPSWS